MQDWIHPYGGIEMLLLMVNVGLDLSLWRLKCCSGWLLQDWIYASEGFEMLLRVWDPIILKSG